LPSLVRPSSVCKLFQKFSPLKPLGQFKPSLAWFIHRAFPLKAMSDDPVDQPSWPPCLLIEHRGKISKNINEKKIQKNPLEYIAIKFDTYVIFFQNYGWGPHPPSNMATIVTINRKLVKKFIIIIF
jgi:hypothetical protein